MDTIASRRAGRWLAAGTLLAGCVHLGVCPEHFGESIAFGLFFGVIAVLQLWWATVAVVRLTGRVLMAGIVVNALPALVWLQSRTVGVPLGPTPWSPEPVHALDLLTSVVEVAVVAVAVLLLGGRRLTAPVLRATGQSVLAWLPRGHALPDAVWRQRHRAILVLLWLHIPGLTFFGVVRHAGTDELVLEIGLLVVIAGLATRASNRRIATITTAIGLLTCSALLVRISGGVIEMHFHYFVMVGVITLYQDWWPFLIAIGYVVLQHGLAGAVDPGAVYNHPEAVRHPWQWAGIHGLFVLGMSSAGVASWRLNESFLGRAHDELAERKVVESDLRDTLSLLSSTLDATADGILVVSTDGRITRHNRRFAEMWGVPEEILAAGDDSAAIEFVLSQLSDPGHFLGKVQELYAQPEAESHDVLEFTDGRIIERFSMPQRVGGEVVGRVWSFHDITERARLEAELAHQAFHDALTGLANKALFRDRLDHAISRHERSGALLAVVFVDLDDFKTINDSLGHNIGDEILLGVADRVRSCIRPSDTAARLGGDEFAVLVEDATSAAQVVDVVERMQGVLRAPFDALGRAVHARASIGIAFGSATATADALLRNADLAMYTAKRQGKDRFAVFQSEMHEAAVARLEMEGAMRRGLEYGEFLLHYQPVVAVRSGELVGAEALVRWAHPTKGLLAPDTFIPLAEDTGLIAQLGRHVLHMACAEARRWIDLGVPASFYITVNVSARQLEDRFIDDVRAALASSGLPATRLILEMTETAMMVDTDRVLAVLTGLKALGVRLAIDDFGTGYSSLSYLQQLPVDVLKIDRAFIESIDHDVEASSLVRTILALATTLHLTAVAEGVETQSQVEALVDLGGEFAQGYHYARPMPGSELEALVAARAHPVPTS
jgi:diguanylate cyclase (GGDEF)-like protein